MAAANFKMTSFYIMVTCFLIHMSFATLNSDLFYTTDTFCINLKTSLDRFYISYDRIRVFIFLRDVM